MIVAETFECELFACQLDPISTHFYMVKIMLQAPRASRLRKSWFLLILSLMLLASGCGKSSQRKMSETQKRLVGSWQEKYVSALHPTLSIFLEDGSFQHMSAEDLDGTGKWQILPDGRLQLSEIVGAQKPTLIFKMEFTGEKELTLTEEGETESRQTLIKIR